MNKQLKNQLKCVKEKNEKTINKQKFRKFYLLESTILFCTLLSSTILSFNKIYTKITNYFPSSSELIPFFMPIYLALLPIIIGVATVIYQLYYNRYTLKDFKNDLKSKFIWLFIFSSFELGALLCFWFTNEAIHFLYFECMFLLVFLIIYFLFFLARFNKFSIGSYVEQYKKNCIKIINSSYFNFSEVENLLKRINVYFTESIEKKENNYIRMIVKAKKAIFIAYLKRSDALILDGTITKDQNLNLIEIFANSLLYDFRFLSETNCSKEILALYTEEIKKILISSIDCNNEKVFIEVFNKLSKTFISGNNSDTYYPILYIFEDIYEYAIENDKFTYTKKLENLLLDLYKIITMNTDNYELIQQLLILNGRYLSMSLKHYSDEEFIETYKIFCDIMKLNIQSFNKRASEVFVGVNFSLLKDIEDIDKCNNCIFDFYVLQMLEFIRTAYRVKNENLVRLLGYLQHEVFTSKLYSSKEDIEDKRLYCLLNVIQFYPDISMLYFPDYEKHLNDDKKNTELCKHIRSQFYAIFNRLSNTNNNQVVYYYLESLNSCILLYDSSDRLCQEEFLDLYKEILIKNIRNNTNSMFDIILSNFDDLIDEMEKRGLVSEKLLEKIFTIFDKVASNLMDTSDYALQSYFLGYFSDLPEKIPSINKHKVEKQRITEILFHLAVEMLESKNEKSLKICSNALGWYAVDLEKQGDIESYRITIESAMNMYNLACEQNYDIATKAFLGTLFIILGAYACSHNEHQYVSILKNHIDKLSDKTPLKISKKLRYFEAKYWNSLFKNDAEGAINNFYQKLKI